MPVRSVTPAVPASTGGLRYYRDADFHDVEQDQRWDQVAGDAYGRPVPFQPIPSATRPRTRRVVAPEDRASEPSSRTAEHASGPPTKNEAPGSSQPERP